MSSCDVMRRGTLVPRRQVWVRGAGSLRRGGALNTMRWLDLKQGISA
jgi:hypothetical protein